MGLFYGWIRHLANAGHYDRINNKVGRNSTLKPRFKETRGGKGRLQGLDGDGEQGNTLRAGVVSCETKSRPSNEVEERCALEPTRYFGRAITLFSAFDPGRGPRA